jgi:hypothetical protein
MIQYIRVVVHGVEYSQQKKSSSIKENGFVQREIDLDPKI